MNDCLTLLLGRVFPIISLPLELLCAAALFTARLDKRKPIRWEIGLANIGVVAVLLALMQSVTNGEILVGGIGEIAATLIWCITWFSTIAMFIYMMWDLPMRAAIYCATLAYLTQHIAYCISEVVLPDGMKSASLHSQKVMPLYQWGIRIGIYLAVYLAVWFFMAKPLFNNGQLLVNWGQSMFATSTSLAISLVFSAVIQLNIQSGNLLYRQCRVYAALCCSLILWGQLDLHRRLAGQRELDIQRQLWLRHKAQYQRAEEELFLLCITLPAEH